MTQGLEEILQNLEKLQTKAPRAARAAVDKGAQVVKERLKVNTPFSTSNNFREYGSTHMRNDVVVTGFKGSAEGAISKDIGYGEDTGWRVHFPDQGTIYQRAQNFTEKSINEATPKVKQMYAETVKRELGL